VTEERGTGELISEYLDLMTNDLIAVRDALNRAIKIDNELVDI
jgi:hypothetical protein